jgi:serine/threonine-protein kinase
MPRLRTRLLVSPQPGQRGAARATPVTPQNPTQLPNLRDYEVDAYLASGSSGTFFAGRHRLTGHAVALQRIATHLTEAPGFVDRLGDTARRIAALRNPHLIGVYDLVVEDGVYLVLELVPGASVRSLAPPGQVLPPASAIAAVDDVLNALETAHAAGIVHGDIRAEHVLVTPSGTAKLGGLAVSQALQVLPGHPGTGRPGYTSPERLAGHPPDESSDLYSAAALASELMTGATPSPGRIGPSALPAIAEVLRRGLSTEAARRYGSATELRTALIGATAGSMGPAWRLASDLGARAGAAMQKSGMAPPALTPLTTTGASEGSVAGFSVPPPPGASVPHGGAAPPPLARPPSTPPPSYLPPPEPRARAAITEVDSEDRKRRPPWLIPLIVILVLAAVGGGLGGAYAAGAFSSSSNSGPLSVGTDVKLTATPQQGGCDTTYNFVATGSVTGAGTLVYRWERSDGQQTPDISVAITPKEGSFKFEIPWRIIGKQKRDERMTFRIVSPTARSVSQPISYSCT